jgi:ABC-type polysaccharide/polyol phosphate export permease
MISKLRSKALKTLNYAAQVLVLAILELNKRYKRSILGIWWSLVTPLITIGIYYFVFHGLIKMPNTTHGDYFIFIVSGVLYLSFVTQTTIMVADNLAQKAPVILRINARPKLLSSSIAVASLINFLIALIPFLIILEIFNRNLGTRVFLLFPFLTGLVLFAHSLGLILSIVYVHFEDGRALIRIVVSFLPYVTPVFYSSEILPEGIRPFIELNPNSQLLDTVRSIIGIGELLSFQNTASIAIFVSSLTIANHLIFNKLWESAMRAI